VLRLRFYAIAVLASILEERGDRPGALDCAGELRALAAEMEREDYTFAAEVLYVRLAALTGALEIAEATARLRTFLEQAGDAAQRARLHDALWQLDPASDVDRLTAAALYRDLYTEREKAEYRRRYQALTGEDLPSPPPFPALPERILGYPGTTQSLLAEVRQVPTPA
jgi:hypothetical protein